MPETAIAQKVEAVARGFSTKNLLKFLQNVQGNKWSESFFFDKAADSRPTTLLKRIFNIWLIIVYLL